MMDVCYRNRTSAQTFTLIVFKKNPVFIQCALMTRSSGMMDRYILKTIEVGQRPTSTRHSPNSLFVFTCFNRLFLYPDLVYGLSGAMVHWSDRCLLLLIRLLQLRSVRLRFYACIQSTYNKPPFSLSLSPLTFHLTPFTLQYKLHPCDPAEIQAGKVAMAILIFPGIIRHQVVAGVPGNVHAVEGRAGKDLEMTEANGR